MIAVQDGEITRSAKSPSLGHFVALRDAYGNTYTYAELGEVSTVYPVLEPHEHSAVSPRIATRAPVARTGSERPRQRGRAAALAAVRRRHRLLARAGRGGDAGIGPPLSATTAPTAATTARSRRTGEAPREFQRGADEVYLHPLRRASR